MIDAHVHIEKGPYTEEWVIKFIEKACEMNIDRLYLLEHSHRFREFKELYESVNITGSSGEYQREWLSRKFSVPLNDYKELIRKMRKREMPVEVKFGLEICYFPGKEDLIKSVTSDFSWDFLTGSIHWIDGWGFDHPKIKGSWNEKNVDEVYKKYYEAMIMLVDSGIFNILAHPDSIKCFNYYPECDLTELYNKLAEGLKRMDMKTEFSCGLLNNFGHKEIGVNRELLRILIDKKVDILTASDAHVPENTGRNLVKANDILREFQQNNF